MTYFNNVKHIHFIGIGGVGVSALARMALLNKVNVAGSDILEGVIFKKIKKLGGKVVIGHKKANLSKETEMVIYSPAIPENNPELSLARKLKIPTYSYPEALGMISKDMYTIAVSGAHGKTTTTSMIAEIMISAKKDPTVVVGGLLKKQKDNFVLGKSKYFIAEACEYKESFLSLFPQILVITNIDNDHLDYYKNIKRIQDAFAKFIIKVPRDKFIVCNPSDKNIKSAIEKALQITNKIAKIIDYTKEKLNIELLIPGEYNIQNAKAALAVAQLIGIKKEQVKNFLGKFLGSWRRFEYKGKTKNGAFIYDDYAHHPTEIRATIKATREKFPDKEIIIVFQPHLYSRLKFLLKDFAKSFNNANKVIVADIYAAREKDDKSIHARDLVKEMQRYKTGVSYIKNFSDIKKYLKKVNDNAVIITMGAGDIYEIGEKLKKFC